MATGKELPFDRRKEIEEERGEVNDSYKRNRLNYRKADAENLRK